MEIITIPLKGGLKHNDNMPNKGIIDFGEIQVISAGSRVDDSEMKANQENEAKTL